MSKQFLWETFQRKRDEFEAINKDGTTYFCSSNDLTLVLANNSNGMTVDREQFEPLSNRWPN